MVLLVSIMQTKVIKEKIKSVGNIKKITKTMEMVSAAKMKKAIDGALLLRPFYEEATEILSHVSVDSLVTHSLLRPNHAAGEILVLISSNKGLCGGYNSNIYKTLTALYPPEKRKQTKIIAIGKYSEKFAKKLQIEVLASFNGAVITGDDARVITTMITEKYLAGDVGSVKYLYTHFTKATTFTPTTLQLLPFKKEQPKDTYGDSRYEYEPSQEIVLDSIIPMLIENIIYGGALESYASEHSARMFAMKSATDNASDIQKDLKLYYNRARQGAVTQEIAEITSGALALTG